MDATEYKAFTRTVAIYPPDKAIEYCALGLCGEAGELANKIKKIIRDDMGVMSEQRRLELIHELGDVLWYAARMADELNIELEQIFDLNAEKLLERKGRGTLSGQGDTR